MSLHRSPLSMHAATAASGTGFRAAPGKQTGLNSAEELAAARHDNLKSVWDQPMLFTEAAAPALEYLPTTHRRAAAWTARVCGGLLGLAGMLGLPGSASAQDVAPPAETMDYTLPFSDASGAAGFVQNEPKIVGGYGMKGRIVHEAGSTVGREQSITSFDIAPYVFINDDSVLFSEGRLFVSNDGRVGGTVITGARTYLPLLNSVLGGGAAYDGDDHRNAWFQQYSFFAEVLTEWADVRFNMYVPFDNEEQIISQAFEPGTAQFVNRAGGLPGTNIAFQQRIRTATLMEGQDVMVSFPIPGELAQNINLESTVGIYHYVADNPDIPEAWGWRLRFDMDLWERLSHMFLEINDDEVFDTNVVFGIDINYWHKLEHRPRLGHSQHQRLADWVRRNRSTVAFTQATLAPPELAINPFTGQPYIALQVNSGALPGGDGRLGTEFDTIQNAINFSAADPDFGTRDIIFVQGGSDFTGAAANVDMNLAADPIQLLGEGPVLNLDVQNLPGGIPLPGVTFGPQPILRDTVGPGVDMSTFSRLAGFTITNINGPAVRANGVSNIQLEELDISNTTGINGDGIRLLNTGGAVLLDDISINNTSGDALSVIGGNAAIRFQDLNTIVNDEGFSVFILDATGSVDMRALTITDTGGRGIAIRGTAPGTSTAAITFAGITLTDTNPGVAADAFQILNHGGSVSFLNPILIDGNNGDNFVITNLQSTGAVSFVPGATLTIDNRNGHGILITDIAEAGGLTGSVTFGGNVLIDTPDATLGLQEAVQFQSASGIVQFNGNLTINGSNGNGVEISNIANTGTTGALFRIIGNTTISDVLGTSFNVDNVLKTNFRVETNGLTINDRGGIGINVSDSAFSDVTAGVIFAGTNTINNQNASTASAITVLNNQGSIGFSVVDINDALGTGPGSFAVRVFNNVNPDVALISTVGFNQLDVESDNTTAVSFESNEQVSVLGGIIESTDGRGVEVLNNTQHTITFTEVNATDADFGIIVANSNGIFRVTGDFAGTGGSGGEISGMSIAGASFFDTNEVELGFIDFEDNFRGVVGNTILREVEADLPAITFTPHLSLQGITIDDSAAEAILLTDVTTFSLTDSVLTDNGRGVAPIQEQIEFLATVSELDLDNDGTDDDVSYNITIDNSSVIDTGNVAAALTTDLIFIHTDPTIADPVDLILNFTNNGDPPTLANSITSNRGGQAAVNVDWEGNFTGTFTNNEFQLLDGNGAVPADDQVGIQLDIDGTATVIVSNNRMSSLGDDATGLLFNFESSANVLISNNFETDINGNLLANSGFVFDGENSTAMDLTFNDPNNTLIIRNNLITFQNGALEADGILIRRIFAPSNVTIEGNSLNFIQQIGGVTQRGIIFQDVRGVINLFGATNNFVGPTFANNLTPFVFIGGGANGSILVNGFTVP